MITRIKLFVAEITNNQKVRVGAIVGLMILAALAGGAPHDSGG